MAQKNAEKPTAQKETTLEENKQNPLFKLIANPKFKLAIIFVIIMVAVFGIIYFGQSQNQIYIEDATISAPIISLTPQIAGTIDKIFVKEGDYVTRNQVLAKVAGKNIVAKTDGIITMVKNTPGQNISLTDPIVQMFDPSELRLIKKKK